MNSSVLCFGKFPVAKKFMGKKGGSIKFSRKNFLYYIAKNCVWELFSV